jgi:hypothetical protein
VHHCLGGGPKKRKGTLVRDDTPPCRGNEAKDMKGTSEEDSREEITHTYITIGEAAGGEDSCDTSSSSDGEGSSEDNDFDSGDNALNKPIEQVSICTCRQRVERVPRNTCTYTYHRKRWQGSGIPS